MNRHLTYATQGGLGVVVSNVALAVLNAALWYQTGSSLNAFVCGVAFTTGIWTGLHYVGILK